MEGEGVRHKNYRQLTPKFSHCTKWLIKYKHVVIIENSRRVWCLILIIPSLRCLQQKDCHKFETAWGTECDPSLKMKPQMENSGLNCHIAHCKSSVRWTELLVFAEFCLDSLGSVWLVLQASPLSVCLQQRLNPVLLPPPPSSCTCSDLDRYSVLCCTNC